MDKEECPDCKGFLYVFRDGKKVACTCAMKRKLEVSLRSLGNYEVTEETKRALSDIDPDQNLYIIGAPKDQLHVNGIVAYLKSRRLLNKTLAVFNIYELIEIFLQHHNDIRSIFHITQYITVLMEGYFEFENKRQPDIILQTLDNRRRLGVPSWYITIGRQSSHSTVHEYLQSRDFKVIDMKALGIRKMKL